MSKKAELRKKDLLVLYIENLLLVKFDQDGRDRFFPLEVGSMEKKSSDLTIIFLDNIVQTFYLLNW